MAGKYELVEINYDSDEEQEEQEEQEVSPASVMCKPCSCNNWSPFTYPCIAIFSIVITLIGDMYLCEQNTRIPSCFTFMISLALRAEY